MIEVQINDLEKYEELKKYASYNSDITHVCAFRDEMSELLGSFGINYNAQQNKKDIENNKTIIPTLSIQGRNIMKLENASAEVLYYVGVRSEFDPTIPIKNMFEVNELIKNNVVQIDDKFKKLYSPIGYNAKIGDLISANVRFYKIGKLTDYIDKDSTIRGLNFAAAKEIKVQYKIFKIKILEALDEDSEKNRQYLWKDHKRSKWK